MEDNLGINKEGSLVEVKVSDKQTEMADSHGANHKEEDRVQVKVRNGNKDQDREVV